MYLKTITYYNTIGEVTNSFNVEMTEDEIEQDMAISAYDTELCENGDGFSVPCYTTDYKKITLSYIRHSVDTNKYKVEVYVTWLKTPVITKYDVIAIRWTGSVNASYVSGTQTAIRNGKSLLTTYSATGTNTKISPRGVGTTMNMYDNASNHKMKLIVQFKGNPGTIYATYQHARHSNITLDMSQSYIFSDTGLGGVLQFNTATITSYYDGMKGLSSSNPYNDTFAIQEM